MWKTLVNWLLSFLNHFYMAFVLMKLWDWFATAALHVSEIAYWNMFGLLMIYRLLTPMADMLAMDKQERHMKMLEACIPENQRTDVMAKIEEDGLSMNMAWGMSIFNGLTNNTLTLCIGWLVHTVLM